MDQKLILVDLVNTLIIVHVQGWSSSDCPAKDGRWPGRVRIGTFWKINNKTIIENPSILFKKKTDMFMHDVVLNGDVPIDLDFDRMFVDTELIDGGLWKRTIKGQKRTVHFEGGGGTKTI